MPSLDLYVRNVELGSEVELYEIDYTNIEGGSILRLTPSVVEGRTSIGFGGDTYLCHPVKLEGVQWDGKNSPSQPSITIAELNNMASALVDGFDDLMGAKLTRYRTYERYLDFISGVTDMDRDMIGVEPDVDQRFPDEIYYFEQVKTMVPGEAVIFGLSTLSDIRNQKIPGRNVIKRVCARPYRRPDPNNAGQFLTSPLSYACPYVGTDYFDMNDQPTTAENDRCSKLETGCKLRFSPEPLPTYAFPAVAASRI